MSVGIIGPVRLSYMHVFEPRANNFKDGKEEYSLTMLLPKEPNEFCPDPKAIGAQIMGYVKAALLKKFGKEPGKWANPLKDGDVETDAEGNPKYPGYWYCNAKSDEKPILIDGYCEPVVGGWQSGDWARVKVNFYGYDRESRGVGAGLRCIQFVAKDEAFGEDRSPEAIAKEFGTVAPDGGSGDPFQ